MHSVLDLHKFVSAIHRRHTITSNFIRTGSTVSAKGLFAALLFLSVSTAASAEDRLGIHALASVGVSVPTDALKDGYNTGLHGLLGVVYDLSPTVGIMPKLEYHYFSLDVPSGMGVTGGGVTTPMFGVDWLVMPRISNWSARPMLTFGGGVSYVTSADIYFDDRTALGGSSHARAYFDLGGGLIFTSSTGPSLFISARYLFIASPGRDLAFIPISVGLKFK